MSLKPTVGGADQHAMSSDLFDLLFERVRAAAFADDAHRRGWEAVRAAAILRQESRHEQALVLLDEVVGHFGYDDVEHGAYACAVAIHCDLGSPQTGITAGPAVWNQSRNPELGNALVRAYWERFEQTGDVDDREAWLAFKDELDAASSAAA